MRKSRCKDIQSCLVNERKVAKRNVERIEWDDNDVAFFFSKVEIKMSAVGVKKQYTKFQVLSTVLPKKVEDQVKSLS